MCGICGKFNIYENRPIDLGLMKKMTYALRHRGPEEFGIYKDKKISLGHARLKIIDLTGGAQPIHNEDKSIWIVFNGEIFNYLELREELIARGHKFYTNTDTEVIIHLYEEDSKNFISKLNGQFAFALWDSTFSALMLARDRMGIRPLFYSYQNGSLVFASEIKSILMDRRINAEIDTGALDQLFTFWATLPPKTFFKNIHELPPAHYLIAQKGNISVKRYWDITFNSRDKYEKKDEDFFAGGLLELLKDSINIRLRADVPVAAYLSGGLDSSLITALVKRFFKNELSTFSVAFADKAYDESDFQREMVNYLGVSHKSVKCTYEDIGNAMPDIIWYTEKPLIRTAPAPLYSLSKLVNDSGIKVVLTGEGADEILAGYDIFREMKIRRFWAKYPDSRYRPMLLRKLYHYLPNWPRTASVFLERFYRTDLTKTDTFYYSHIPKWKTTSWIKSFFSEDIKDELKENNVFNHLSAHIPDGFRSWDHLSQAQYLEIITLLSGNLLSSQGDRMMAAHSIEGRFPFLDHRLVEFCASIPPQLRLKVLNEKYILKKVAGPYIPDNVLKRIKQGYRAPDIASFFGGKQPEYLDDLLSRINLLHTGYFDADAVKKLISKCKETDISKISARQNTAIVGIITTLLLDKMYIRDFDKYSKSEDMPHFSIIDACAE